MHGGMTMMITGIVPGTVVAHGTAVTAIHTVAMAIPMAVTDIRTVAMVTLPMAVTAIHTGVMLILTVAMLIPMEQLIQHLRKNRQPRSSQHTDQAAVIRTSHCSGTTRRYGALFFAYTGFRSG